MPKNNLNFYAGVSFFVLNFIKKCNNLKVVLKTCIVFHFTICC